MPAAPVAADLMVENLAGLLKAFNYAEKDVKRAGRAEVAQVARPIQQMEEGLTVARFRNIAAGDPWSKFRVGVTQKLVYVVPKQKGTHGRGGRRAKANRKFGRRLAELVVEPARARNRARVERAFDQMLGRVAGRWGSGG